MSYLYVISHPLGWRKIGRADDPFRRLVQHQSKCGSPLVGEAICLSDDPIGHERRALLSMNEFRIMGEWFTISYEQAVQAISTATGSEVLPFPAMVRNGVIRKPEPELEFSQRLIILRIMERLGLPDETSTYDYLSASIDPWVDELKRKAEVLGNEWTDRDDKWTEYVKASFGRAAASRRRFAAHA